ncbi:MAG: GNAT family N-acetyltransferase, partial [Gemmatimonadota bacterium]|nr:GNAT family N-acetyltransferase [Gemmatimonadota bacterium]
VFYNSDSREKYCHNGGARVKLIKKCDPREVEKIQLGADDYIDHLYGCFRFDNPRGGRFEPERAVEIVFRSGKKIGVSVPEAMSIELPEGKVVNTEFFTLEPVGGHLDTMMLLTMRAGWNQTEGDLARIVGLDPSGTFVARLAGADFDIPVATATLAPLGERHTWIGMILVHPELRRQGMANAMMQHCVREAIERGKILNGLDATPMGNTVYGAVGYVDSYRIWRSWFRPSEFRDSPHDTDRISPVAPEDLDELIRYDSARFLERANIIRALYEDSKDEAYLYRNDNGDLAGYVFARPGRLRYFVGPFTADSKQIATGLLACVCKSLDSKGIEEAFIDTPENKFDNPGVYDRSKFDQEKKPTCHQLIRNITPVRDFTRMYQAVDERKAEDLIENFTKVEKLERSSERVEAFAGTMRASTANYTETMGFMEYEARVLQKYYWGITGPEKG